MGICPLDNAWQASRTKEPIVIGKPFAGSALIEKAAYRLTLILCIVIIGLHCFFYQDRDTRIDSLYNDIAQCLERTEMLLRSSQIINQIPQFCAVTVSIVVMSNQLSIFIYICRTVCRKVVHLLLQHHPCFVKIILVHFRSSQMSSIVRRIFTGASRPQGMFVCLDDIYVDVTKNHGSHITVTDRQSFTFPVFGRLIISCLQGRLMRLFGASHHRSSCHKAK